MLTNEERIQQIETSVVKLNNDTKELATDDELDAVVTQIFDKQIEIKCRIAALKNNLVLVKYILDKAQG